MQYPTKDQRQIAKVQLGYMTESKLWLFSGMLFGVALLIELLINQDYSEFNMVSDGLLYGLQAIVTISCFYYYFVKRKAEQKNG